MRLSLVAVGRLRGGPEAALVEDYLARIEATGRGVALGPAQVIEIDERRHRGMAAEGEALLAAAPAGPLVALDERGRTMTSPAFAALLAGWRDDGARDAALLIGGADGLAPSVRERADTVLSLGPMVWPHRLVRVMLAEQLFRAASILAGTPYHRA